VTFECVSHAPPYPTGSDPTCPADTSSPTTNCHPTGSATPVENGGTGCDAVHITEQATVTSIFAGLFGPSWTVSASATAAARGGIPIPLNVYVILDNTQSMTDSCAGTGGASPVPGIPVGDAVKLDCAKYGVQTLLDSLWPCSQGLTTCGSAVTANGSGQLGANVAAPVDEVGMLVVPAITGTPPPTATLDEETDCVTNGETFPDEYPPWTSYMGTTIPSSDEYQGYEAIGLSSDYRSSAATSNTTLNSYPGAETGTNVDTNASQLVESVDWGQCPNHAYPATTGGRNPTNPDPYDYGLKDVGGHGSYLAGAITEAQYLLQQNARAGATNVIIIESDGEMTEPTTFANGTQSKTPCEDADKAATQAKAAGTVIYTVEYDSNGQCGADNPTDTYDNADTLMADMATDSDDYFDDPTAADLTATFGQVGTDLTSSTLIPDCTQPIPSC